MITNLHPLLFYHIYFYCPFIR